MSGLLSVAEGILDSAASEYADYNLATVGNVAAYADAIGISLDDDQAELVRAVCWCWRQLCKAGIANSQLYHETVTGPLSEAGE